jgi:putative PEP-CTERM system histidine kinase
MKNGSAQLSLICANAERHRDNPEFVADAFATVANARDRLERTQAQLRNVQPRLETPRQVIAVQDLLEEIVAGSPTAQPVPALEIREPAEILGDREALKNLLLHLVRNAQEATPDDGRIQLSLYNDGTWTTILVQDTGSGIDEEFLRRRLFRPFQTTKGNAGMGIGLYEARDRILRMGGRIDVHSKVGEGTLFTLRLPTHQRQPAVVDDCERRVTNDG